MTTFPPVSRARANVSATVKVAAIAAAVLVAPLPATASGGLFETTAKSASPSGTEEDTVGIKNGSFVAAPIPSRSIELGFGLAGIAAYLFQMDEGSSASYFGLGYFESENNSLAYGAAGSLSFDNDNWKLGAYAGYADINYNMYIANLPVPLNQTGELADVSLKYQVAPEIYVGGEVQYFRSRVSLNSGGLLPPELTPSARMSLLIGSVLAEYDTRDDTIYPTQGIFAEAKLSYGTDLDGLVDDYHRTIVKLQGHWPLGDNGVLVGRFTGCVNSASTPFFSKCAIGGTDSLRGFAPMRYVGNGLASVQGEYRHRFNNWFGAVAFAGAGMTDSDFDGTTGKQVHAAAGIGLRVRLNKNFPLDYSIDAAISDEGDQSLYLYVGQRF
ncbi:BamA/TamA family outer membrane protein [Shimia biformata]|uniref:BamA/TamA family outer membrane protein n=1 Tax=Shimia biformata TaxID=1294299 RepID=UPI00194F12C6|nr:BamA/TamA family outer membrane protein [Shimia biformata]